MDIYDRYRTLMLRHQGMVWLRCLRHSLGNSDRARDLYQDVMLNVWERLEHLSPEATTDEERRWLKTQTRSVIAHHARRRSLDTVPLAEAAGVADDREEDRRRSRERLAELTARLPDDDRRLVQLYCDGFSYDEIAQKLHTSRDAVYQRMHRAVSRMKEIGIQYNL